jgi:hypothetical protein
LEDVGRTQLRPLLQKKFPDHQPRTLRLYGQHAYHYLLLQRKRQLDNLPESERHKINTKRWFDREAVLDKQSLIELGNSVGSVTSQLERNGLFSAGQLQSAARLANPNTSNKSQPNAAKSKDPVKAEKAFKELNRLLDNFPAKNNANYLLSVKLFRDELQKRSAASATANKAAKAI